MPQKVFRKLITLIQDSVSQPFRKCPKCKQSGLAKNKFSAPSSSPWQNGLEIESYFCSACGYSAEIRWPMSPGEQFPQNSSPAATRTSYPGGASAGCSGGCG